MTITLNGQSTGYESEYRSWYNMKHRCYYPQDKRYSRYGGRGIKVCERWLQSFTNFLSDMGRKPTPKHTLDRINNDGNYEPGNCRWVTVRENNYNRSVSSKTPGLRKLSSGRWTASLKVRRRWVLYKTYDTYSKARQARRKAEAEFL